MKHKITECDPNGCPCMRCKGKNCYKCKAADCNQYAGRPCVVEEYEQ